LIDDEIIAGIRRSKFVVADFTENSYGAYYEAGFARGFNLSVIYLCNEQCFSEEKTKPHFDVNHYSMTLWDYDKGNELAEKLKNRIEATIGRGPVNFI
jgi:hypothetical protein